MLADGQEPDIPAYYVLGRHVRDEESIMAALRLTPVYTALVSNVLDYDFAASVFSTVFLISPQQEQATREAIGRPVVVFGDAEFLDAVYADGRRQSLAAHA